MKKLMIAAVAVAFAACAQAASFSWKTSMSDKVYQPGTTTLLASATAYLFDASTVTQASLVTAFANNTLDLTTGNISSQAISSGAIANTVFEDGTAAGDTLSAYFATIVTIDSTDYLFISDAVAAAGQVGKTTPMQFNAKDASQAAALDATAGYSGAGWYAVPEPTSGLLLLLGMAGLALRRKQK